MSFMLSALLSIWSALNSCCLVHTATDVESASETAASVQASRRAWLEADPAQAETVAGQLQPIALGDLLRVDHLEATVLASLTVAELGQMASCSKALQQAVLHSKTWMEVR